MKLLGYKTRRIAFFCVIDGLFGDDQEDWVCGAFGAVCGGLFTGELLLSMLFVGLLLIGYLLGKDFALEEKAGDTRDEGRW